MLIRVENKSDHKDVENVTREAFWNLFQPGADEHYLVHMLRQSPDFIKELSLVAVENNKIVGNIVYSSSHIKDKKGKVHAVITFGPISVLPSMQGKGIGSSLIKESIKRAKELGYRAVVILGYPHYYERFGFQNGSKFGVSMPDGSYPKALQVLELYKNALKEINGKYLESAVFQVDGEKCREFDKQFPTKEKFVTVSQKAFEMMSTLKYDDPDPVGIDQLSQCRERFDEKTSHLFSSDSNAFFNQKKSEIEEEKDSRDLSQGDSHSYPEAFSTAEIKSQPANTKLNT